MGSRRDGGPGRADDISTGFLRHVICLVRKQVAALGSPAGRTVTSGYSDKLVANRIQVTPENIYFTCELDTYDEQELFEGIYDRRTGRTRLSPASHEGYTDDLTGFMPVPRRYPHGVQVSLIEAYKVVEWLDEHPEARSNSALAGLAQVKEEDNPVAVFVRYK